MNNNMFLIPANSKKSMLIFGLFNIVDLIVFGSGVMVSFLLLLILPIEQIAFGIIALAPALVTGFLVFPIPNYHNTLRFIISALEYFLGRQKFTWKGWCCRDGEEESK